MRPALALLAVAAAGCPGDSHDAPATPAPPPTTIAPIDAPFGDGGITEIRGYDPASGMHLDEDDPTAAPTPGAYPRPRNRRTLEILLRSTPPGATAVVDGQTIGKTPILWEGEFTGREREFTFVLRGHSLGRYRFVPIQSGIVHAKLRSIIGEDDALRDAGITLRPPPTAPPPRRPVVRPPALPDARPADPPADAGEATFTPTQAPPDTGFGPPP